MAARRANRTDHPNLLRARRQLATYDATGNRAMLDGAQAQMARAIPDVRSTNGARFRLLSVASEVAERHPTQASEILRIVDHWDDYRPNQPSRLH